MSVSVLSTVLLTVIRIGAARWQCIVLWYAVPMILCAWNKGDSYLCSALHLVVWCSFKTIVVELWKQLIFLQTIELWKYLMKSHKKPIHNEPYQFMNLNETLTDLVVGCGGCRPIELFCLCTKLYNKCHIVLESVN